MTEKDAVKCRAFADENWWYLPVDAHLSGDRPDVLLNSLITIVIQYQYMSFLHK